MKEAVFYLGFATLCSHELDAVLNHEWRLLPLVRALPDEVAATVFVVAHVPLFAILVALLASSKQRTRRLAPLGIAGFLVLYGALHLLLSGDSAYAFSGPLSNGPIFGGSLLGIVYLAFGWQESRRL